MRTNKLVLLLFVIGFLVPMGQVAIASPIAFSDTYDWSGLNDGTITYAEIDAGNNSDFEYTYSHSLTFVPSAESILSAEIQITHEKNSSGEGEFWLLSALNGPVFIGNLSDSNNSWITDTFTIPLSLYPDVPASSWTLALVLSENTNGRDKIFLDKSVLSGYYDDGNAAGQDPIPGGDPIPEPASLLLLGTGLGVLWLSTGRRRRK